MKIFKNFDEIKDIPHPVLTIGTFDGVHIGHQKIINRLNEVAKKQGGESVVFTFFPHPRMVLFPDSHNLKLIQTQQEKLDKLERMGLQNIIIHPFTKAFSRIPAQQFVRDYLVNKLKVKTIIIGYDHHFGKNREGNIQLLKELSSIYEYDVIEISAEEIDEVNISSTKIRNAIQKGDIHLADTYLGEYFELNGIVIEGEKLGRKLGFPTANIDLESEIKLVPKDGVYATKVKTPDGTYHFGLLSIGKRPTVTDSGDTSIEVYLLDFEGDLYGKRLTVELLRRIRNDEKFDSLDTLKIKMQTDEKILRDWMVDYHWV